ncbi:DUF523 domain-containing protein [Psychrobium sp. 1_MG-2023]|uniref:DUF523 domain-containing protein n=1 Tax=Psychrobium sp. 1_MG-2023 TaxID=3062624 RepID=UPI000C34175B|nr:DUF523 domain-containing protein [Psychrobium sp. 1_MG-2023]MDP2561472.1 DUF523 domain-containing protein [Psychrobium sp. 1_MG-2023]PKF57739.1 DUF523 domain-containing protein [Alteromonadales bacterium alter-6D02]
MEKILISACLLGRKVRYDGQVITEPEQLIMQWKTQGRVIAVCPEVDAGMAIPRLPAEIIAGDSQGVIEQRNRVMDKQGDDVTDYFIKGAHIALSLCQQYDIKVAILTERSPSCGSSEVYDGEFTNKLIVGQGVTTTLLRAHGVKVFNQHQLRQAHQYLLSL